VLGRARRGPLRIGRALKCPAQRPEGQDPLAGELVAVLLRAVEGPRRVLDVVGRVPDLQAGIGDIENRVLQLDDVFCVQPERVDLRQQVRHLRRVERNVGDLAEQVVELSAGQAQLFAQLAESQDRRLVVELGPLRIKLCMLQPAHRVADAIDRVLPGAVRRHRLLLDIARRVDLIALSDLDAMRGIADRTPRVTLRGCELLDRTGVLERRVRRRQMTRRRLA
jgi:hypothetical protein